VCFLDFGYHFSESIVHLAYAANPNRVAGRWSLFDDLLYLLLTTLGTGFLGWLLAISDAMHLLKLMIASPTDVIIEWHGVSI